jgi:hypothetical protein
MVKGRVKANAMSAFGINIDCKEASKIPTQDQLGFS